MSRSFNRILLIGVTLSLAACDGLPFRIVPVTPTPTPSPAPTVPPPPTTEVIFTVVAPANTPAGAQVAVQLIDDVTGARPLIPLNNVGGNVWTGTTPAMRGDVLRYRYVRTAPGFAEELTPLNRPVPYRLFVVSEDVSAATDIVAAWSDTRWGGGDQGALVGYVRNANTNQGVAGVLVNAAGQNTLTAHDGYYAIYNVPSGNQRVTILAPDGYLRPTQNMAGVPPSQVVQLDLSSPDPNSVSVTFVMTPPANTDGAATPRIIGNLAQLGSTFTLQPDGTSIVGARAPTLFPLNDGTGRFAISVRVFEGTVIRYAYTLGDGFWNTELDETGRRRLRTYVVPFGNSTQYDTVTGWHTGNFPPVVFEVTTPPDTPPGDLLTIQFRTSQWLAPQLMGRLAPNRWRFVLYNPLNFTGNVGYRYCRNFACGAADDIATAGAASLGRLFTPTVLPQAHIERVNAWRWWSEAPAPDLSALPQQNIPRPELSLGVVLAELWQPAALPLYPEMLGGVRASSATSLTIMRRSLMRSVSPPLLADDPALTMPEYEVRALAEQAREAGLAVVLHPVTCAYTPYGPCDYFNGYTPDALWYEAYERHMLTQASLAAAIAADTLVIGDYKLQPTFPGEPGAPPDAEARWRRLIARVRERYGGRLAFELLLGDDIWPNPPPFLDSVNFIRVHWWASLAGNSTASLTEMTAAAGNLMDARLKPLKDRFPGKFLHLSVAYYSADGTATQCLRRPDGSCHPFTDFNPEAPDVGAYGLDLGEQANAYYAVLSAAYERPWINGVATFGYNPLVSLRDKSLSVRGKPAEAVLAAWYLRYLGR
ncbi:MAG: hypothetical protein RMK99_09845 [Anaerolineales bacterium]|nr:hypothetical protein [Anaerolineales bacterium]